MLKSKLIKILLYFKNLKFTFNKAGEYFIVKDHKWSENNQAVSCILLVGFWLSECHLGSLRTPLKCATVGTTVSECFIHEKFLLISKLYLKLLTDSQIYWFYLLLENCYAWNAWKSLYIIRVKYLFLCKFWTYNIQGKLSKRNTDNCWLVGNTSDFTLISRPRLVCRLRSCL